MTVASTKQNTLTPEPDLAIGGKTSRVSKPTYAEIEAFCQQAAQLRARGDYLAAEAVLTPLLEANACVEPVLCEHAQIAHDERKFEIALERWRQLLEVEPTHLIARRRAIDALLALHRYDEADVDASQLLADHPGHLEAVWAWAWTKHQRGDWSEAATRWQSFVARYPANRSAWCCLITALSRGDQRELARKTGRTATEQFPDDADIALACAWISDEAGQKDFSAIEQALVDAMARDPAQLDYQLEHAKIAQIRGDRPEAERRWVALRERYRAEPVTLATIGYHQMLAGLHELDEQRVVEVAPTLEVAGESSTRLRDLFMSMESLGDNCEFGEVQRKFGAEPLGLLRFSGISPENLVTALAARFEGVGSPEEIRVTVAANGEYRVRDAYDIQMHSFVFAKDVSLERFLTQVYKRNTFLRNKLIKDLEAADKLFVYKRSMTQRQAIVLYNAMCRYGDVNLMCVLPADAEHPPGTVIRRTAGLLFGYTRSYEVAEGFVHNRYDEWLELAERAQVLRQRSEPRPTS
jgi:tetratricopeptide (TPR) repeat protein